ncbi:S1 family peptidase [Fulvimonas soli]|jgi:hypothetical protein|uniref:Trypsin-like peptidase n=1 Tax=Fulvimonas soli TaxID=155197 RepID=A0A316HNH1_9GAMM|nr:serine protease [Fulvimonas soli]PWK81544.1 trypsin-like peptidase [Fulvimonas soli]TNY26730.1 serine protease [Fulvimonas soli]
MARGSTEKRARGGDGWRGWLGRLALLALAAGPAHAAAAVLDPAVLPQVQAATFEVVVPKPASDPLSYEKPLPLELLPYQFRTDKYFSIGTAFALGDDRYVTAAHVLDVGIGSLLGEPALRDASGQVYAIDKILEFSQQRDFVVFSLAHPPKVKPLPVDAAPALNQAVYAVGNALGTGVVIRDGLYTSNTPEEQDGRWKWIRFSAAASPGNSGGPLLDKDGKVIGVVLMKSANENLNYALPIAEVLKAPANTAVLDQRRSYQFDVFDATQVDDVKGQFALPKSFAEFGAAYLGLVDGYSDSQLGALLAKDPEHLFPHGSGSNRLLYGQAYLNGFPSLVMRDSDGDWGISHGSVDRQNLPHNGYVERSHVGHQGLFHLRRPDDVTADRLYHDPQLLMDLILKVAPLQRPVATEQIKITSLGKPQQDTVYTDGYHRRWQVRSWPLAYSDTVLICFALPVPDGYAAMVRFAKAGPQVHDSTIDLKALTDFVYLSYDGTLAQWRDFLKQDALLPDALRAVTLDVDYGKRLAYRSPRLAFAYTPALQAIQPDSGLTLGFSYFVDHGKVVWDVAQVLAKASVHDSDVVRLNRLARPADGMDDNFRSEWDKLRRREHPVDGVAFNGDDATMIDTIGGSVGPKDDPGVIYTAAYATKGNQPQAAMKAKLDLLLKDLEIRER